MDNQFFIVRFEGAEAEYHELDLRKLGESLIGIEKIITIALSTVIPTHPSEYGGRLQATVRASMPRRGSFEIEVFMAVVGPALLGLFPEELTRYIDKIWSLISVTLLKIGNRESDSQQFNTELLKFLKETEAHRHTEVVESQKLLRAMMQLVTPIGSSCERISLLKKDGEIEIDASMAEAIRSKCRIRIGDMENFRVRVLGFTHYNKRLTISLHDNLSKVSAQLRDPTFNNVPNIYTTAAINQEWLDVKARARRLKDGQIKELYIFDANPVLDSEEE